MHWSTSIFALFLLFLFLLLVLKVYIKVTTGKCRTHTCLVGKTAIITGANSGLGYQTALEFAKRGARIIMGCRNRKLAEEARQKIVEKTGNANVLVKYVDMTKLESIRSFVRDINETEPKIHILVNNAGSGVGMEQKLTQDGLLMLMQTNYFGGVYLVHLLLDKLKTSAPSRIIHISSVCARFRKLSASESINEPLTWGPLGVANFRLYCQSKLCLMLHTIALAKRLRGTGVTVNALHPGVIKTKIFETAGGVFNRILLLFLNYWCKNVVEGTQTTVYVATSQDLVSKSGCYFADCQELDFHSNVNAELVESVWKQTEDLLRLNSEIFVK